MRLFGSGVYLGMEDTLRLQTELVVVVWLVQNVFQSQESKRTHRIPVPPEDTHLQLSSLGQIWQETTCTK